MIIDGKNASLGRLCSFAAKQALSGNEVIVVNSEKVIITGNKKDILTKYRSLVAKGGHSQKGPKYIRIPYRMLKRSIRGMLPDHRSGTGKQAFLNVKCHDGIPTEFEGKEMKTYEAPKSYKFISLKELAEKL